MFKPAEEIREEFDKAALKFDRNGGVPTKGLIYEYLSGQLPSRGELALDIGCGLGGFTSRLAERFERVVALDLSPEMVRVVRKNTSEYTNIEFIIADVNKWDFPAAQFDCIVSITTLHHMPLEPVLKKMKDGLRPGGILLVGDLYESRGIRKYKKTILSKIKEWRRKLFKSNSQKRSASRPMWEHDLNERFLPMKEVRRICDSLLQDAKVVEHQRHYSIVWIKP